jgi:hypothetical protein
LSMLRLFSNPYPHISSHDKIVLAPPLPRQERTDLFSFAEFKNLVDYSLLSINEKV